MLCDKPAPIRNKLDLADSRQVRTLKKRLGVSADDLTRAAEKVGTSIAAVTKEVETRNAVVSDTATSNTSQKIAKSEGRIYL